MRVIVLGAGLSGLAAALRLAQAGGDVLVLEARGRVGGRAWRLPVGEAAFEAGCEVLSAGHGGLLRLADEVGVETWAGGPWLGRAEPDLPAAELAPFRALEEELDALAARIDPLSPGETDGAGRLDGQTLAGRLADHGASPACLAAAERWYATASASVPLERMSFLGLAAKRAAGADPDGLPLRLAGGPAALAARIAALLEGRVRLGAEAVAVEEGERSVAVRLADGTVESSGRVVLALPLTLQRMLRFDPPLPPERALALRRARYGDVVKAAGAYDEPPGGDYPALGDDGLLYRPEPDAPVLALFAGARAARRLARPGRPERVLGGGPRAVAVVDWSRERFTRGSYLVFGPGELTTWGRRLAEPRGRLHFAGAEASPLPSYMEGAVHAGERAAAEALAAG